jgi:hypothetical protein
MGFFANVFVVFFNPAYYETTKNATRTLKKKKKKHVRTFLWGSAGYTPLPLGIGIWGLGVYTYQVRGDLGRAHPQAGPDRSPPPHLGAD